MSRYLKKIIKKFHIRNITTLDAFIITTVVYILGFVIYNIPIAGYFPNLRLSGIRLIEYVSATLLWIASFFIFYQILSYVDSKFISLNKFKFIRILKISIAIIIFLILIYFLSYSIFVKKTGPSHFIQVVCGKFADLIFGPIRGNFVIKDISNIIFNQYFLLYFISSIYIINAVKKNTEKYTRLLFILLINLISFSHAIYTKIPKTFGGGRIISANIIFKKGYIPTELKTIIKTKDYYAFIIDEDENSYYIVFQEDDPESFYKWFYSKSIFETIFVSQNDFRELWTNANIIPKENVVRVIIR